MKVYLARHGQTDWNVEHRIQGQADVPLNEKGIRQAEELREKIKDLEFDICIASPLKRARETAEIAVGDRCEIICDERIKERGRGDYEGKIVDSWEKVNSDPSVETIPSLMERARDFVEEMKVKYPADYRVLIVCHNNIGKAVLFSLEGVEGPDFDGFHLGNGEVREVELGS